MNWIQENKFLTGFLVAMLVGAGVLSWLVFSAGGRFSEAQQQFETQTAELRRLQSLAPYPEQGNLKKLQDQKQAYDARIAAMKTALIKMELPLEPISPQQFQDKLKESVTGVVKAAAEANVKLPEKFYLGFDLYQSSPPRDEAAALLSRQLKAIETVVHLVLSSKAVEITGITRPPLPEEAAGAQQASDSKPGVGKQSSSADLVKTSPFEISFLTEQGRLRKVINDIASLKQPFLVVRSLSVKNENEKGASRAGDAPAPGAVAAPVENPVAAAAPVAPGLRFVMGDEKLAALLKIDILDFAEPAPATAKK